MTRILRDIKSADEFDQVYDIMDASFPKTEHRPYEKQKKLLDNPAYRLFGVSRAQVFQYRKLEHLIDPLLDALDRKELSLRTALAFSDLTPELQEIAYHRAYYVDATAAQLKKLKSIENEADLKAIFETIPDAPEKYQYVFSTTIPKPENYDTVSFYIGEEEHDAFKALLQDALAHNDQISNQTKRKLNFFSYATSINSASALRIDNS